jgi:hypothetical protein
MKPLHVVDKLNAIPAELPSSAIDRPRFVTQREKWRGDAGLMVEQQTGPCHTLVMPHVCDQTAACEKSY